jgi:chemotaxis protein MotB
VGKKKQEEKEPEEDTFIVLLCALSLILLAFFILLNSIAVIDDQRARDAMGSLISTFGAGVLPGFMSVDAALQELQFRPPKFEMIEQDVNLFVLIRRYVEENKFRGVDVKTSEDGRVVVELEDAVFFEPGGWQLSPIYFKELDALGDLIKSVGHTVRIEGHADPSISSRGQSNWFLSASRAGMVYRYLVATANFPATKISAAGFAHFRLPVMEGGLPARRVQIIFLPEEKKTRRPGFAK